MSLIFAIGDIHGSLHKLQDLIERCERYADGRPMTFIFLGDYIDRGPDSAGVVSYVIDLQARLPEQVIALKGNHEAMALDIVDGVIPADRWLAQGGFETLRSYGVRQRGRIARRACALAAFIAGELRRWPPLFRSCGHRSQ